jgi:hypothetical protein
MQSMSPADPREPRAGWRDGDRADRDQSEGAHVDIETEIRAYAERRRFGAGVLGRWLGQPAGDRAALLALVGKLRLGENQVRDLIDRLEDVAARRGTTPGAVLADPMVAGVLERDLGRNEAIHALRLALDRLRYPRRSSVEAGIRQLVKGLDLPSGVKVELPAELEGDSVSFTVSAATAGELRARVQLLAASLRREEVDRIYALLDGRW